MVRLVFRPYTQIRRSICTSEPLRASTRVSSGFTLFRYSSPSFGSQQLCSYSNPSASFGVGRLCALAGSNLLLSLRAGVLHPNTRIDVRLLGPCFKTGGLQPLRQHPSLERRPRTGEGVWTGAITRTEVRHMLPRLSASPNRCWPGKSRVCLQALPFQQFHVLFHSLFKVLFIFPSLYLFAIGLSPIFSFRWNLPPTLSCIPKQLDSSGADCGRGAWPDGALTLPGAMFQWTWAVAARSLPPSNYNSRGISNLSFCRFTRRY